MGAYEFNYASEISATLGLPPGTVTLCGNAINSGIQFSPNTIKLNGSLIGHSASSGFTFTSQNQGRLTFRWNVSSEYYFDTLSFYVDDVLTAQISGKNVTWASVTNTVLIAGPHTFKWEYAKDSDTSVGQDAAWISDVAWTPRSTLTVDNGSGDGDYFIGDVIPVTADPAPAHYVFDRWTGYTNGVSDVASPSTTLVMPGTSIVVTASYTPILYTLSVTDGSGSGSYPYASSIEIGSTPYEGKRFYRWTGDVDTVANVWSATTTVQTADHTLHVGATYSYPLTVNNGTGGGWYPATASVNIAAGTDPLYKEFAFWTGDAAGFLSDPSQRETSLTMPANTATLTPSYIDSISRVSGSYGRNYVLSGTEDGVTADSDAGSPSGTPAVKLGGAGVVPNSGFAAFETVVSGSGTVTFWWKVSSEGGADYLKFLVDGSTVQSISGTKSTWAQVTNRVEGAGVDHTLRWEYVKDVSDAFGSDAGWVDDIVWTGDVPAPAIRPDIQTANLDTNLFTVSFLGERGIPYTIYSNATLRAWEWEPMPGYPLLRRETNGVFLFDSTPIPAIGQSTCFFRVATGTPVPRGMIKIPAGTNSGTDPDFGAYSLSVETFYMDIVEVTKALWDQVKEWNGGNGYTYENTGLGNDQNHPVQTVNWYDAVKWCNARSQKEGREPVYYTDAGYSVIYKTGRVLNPYVKASADGYRLPTALEWEYAARGGAVGKRYPWIDSDEIQHTRANYNSQTNQVYDTSLTRGTHPLYNGTSSVGSFKANGYGLYDMVGNVWEWCWDWYPGSEGSGRTLHGGSWTTHADYCRNAKSYNPAPFYTDNGMGFRTVLH